MTDMIEHAAQWQRHGAYYHRDAMALRDMMMRHHPIERSFFIDALRFTTLQAEMCYRRARIRMGLEE